MATFEDPTLVEKLDANLGSEAAATAKKMKFLNFFVSLAWPGLVLRTAWYQMIHHSDRSTCIRIHSTAQQSSCPSWAKGYCSAVQAIRSQQEAC